MVRDYYEAYVLFLLDYFYLQSIRRDHDSGTVQLVDLRCGASVLTCLASSPDGGGLCMWHCYFLV